MTLKKSSSKRSRLSETVRDWKPGEELWKDIALKVYEELNTPRSLKLHMCLSNGDYRQVATEKINPMDYNCRHTFQKDWLAVEFLRKFSGFPGIIALERRQAALEKAAAAERRCYETNRRLLDWELGSGFPAGVESVISRAQRKIIHVLGHYSLDEHLDSCRWGPGSDALNRRPYVSSYHKFKSLISATKGVMPLVQLLMERNSLWSTWLCGRDVSGPFSPISVFFKGNGALTVPKTALTDRFICIEPAANIYLQLGLGAMIRRRLRRVGIDMKSQETNRMLALEGSQDSSWATIDLSSASDTIASRLIYMLLSSDPELRKWLKVLEMTRSPFTDYGTRKRPDVRLNHKFSSMGNGFTFELETLVFWAIASSAAEQVGGKCASVYGDDIIVSNGSFDRVCEVLELVGFEVNTKKSYNSSYFRESCGMDCWDGYELASYRLTSLANLAECYSLHNGLRRCGLTRSASYVLHRIPSFLRFFGPSGAGDGVLHSTDWATWKVEPHGLTDQWFFWAARLTCIAFKPVKAGANAYEPAIIHSLATMVPLSDHPVYTGNRWGSEGLVTLSDGEWTVSEMLVSREKLGMPAAWGG